eukprot:CAMPEP_0202711554 /NCGR_PEP_ID=MMETSP1385-20130828/23329_1 /ASSEMBLY_ACC=CAM_ASM_000861 /TAXON_ID=933848 /ORGANISM="Elphidium margaritaceum" /LENGTH=223 /DNA_ID=CAMNT_0049371307 /DNA_START=26 /DNA_END=697 /DNA_ORIENTATION=-
MAEQKQESSDVKSITLFKIALYSASNLPTEMWGVLGKNEPSTGCKIEVPVPDSDQKVELWHTGIKNETANPVWNAFINTWQVGTVREIAFVLFDTDVFETFGELFAVLKAKDFGQDVTQKITLDLYVRQGGKTKKTDAKVVVGVQTTQARISDEDKAQDAQLQGDIDTLRHLVFGKGDEETAKQLVYHTDVSLASKVQQLSDQVKDLQEKIASAANALQGNVP